MSRSQSKSRGGTARGSRHALASATRPPVPGAGHRRGGQRRGSGRRPGMRGVTRAGRGPSPPRRSHGADAPRPRDRRDRGRRGSLQWRRNSSPAAREPRESQFRLAGASSSRRARSGTGSIRSRRERHRAHEATLAGRPLTLERHLHRRRRARHGHRGASDRPASVGLGRFPAVRDAGRELLEVRLTRRMGLVGMRCTRAPGDAATRASCWRRRYREAACRSRGAQPSRPRAATSGWLRRRAGRHPESPERQPERIRSPWRSADPGRAGREVAHPSFEAGAPARPAPSTAGILTSTSPSRTGAATPGRSNRSTSIRSSTSRFVGPAVRPVARKKSSAHLERVGRCRGAGARQAERCVTRATRSPRRVRAPRCVAVSRRRRACRRAAPERAPCPRGAAGAREQRFPCRRAPRSRPPLGLATTSRWASVPSARRT